MLFPVSFSKQRRCSSLWRAREIVDRGCDSVNPQPIPETGTRPGLLD